MQRSSTVGTLAPDNASKGKEFNEFARIEGLGPAMQRWLRETFHVYTVADLANLSVNRVLSRLEDEEKEFCRREIERWIQQAQQFAAQQTSWRTFATFVVSLQSRQVGGQTDQRTTAYFLEADRRAIWSGIECNGVYELMLDQLKHVFQSQPEVISQMESESSMETTSADVSPSQPEPASALEQEPHEPETEAQTVIDHETVDESSPELETVAESIEVESSQPESTMEEIVDTEPEDKPLESPKEVSLKTEAEPEPEPEITEPITLEITQLKFWQPFNIEEPVEEEPETKKAETKKAESEEDEAKKPIVVNMAKRSLSGMLRKEEPFELEVTFQITGTGASDLTRESLNYHLQCFIQNRENRKGIQLESKSTDTLTIGELTYTKRLPEIMSLKPGLYRLQVITRLDGGYAQPDLFELPFVQVI